MQAEAGTQYDPDIVQRGTGIKLPAVKLSDREPGDAFTQTPVAYFRDKRIQASAYTRSFHVQASPTLRESFAQTEPTRTSYFAGGSSGMALIGAAAVGGLASLVSNAISGKQNRDTQIKLMDKQINFSKEMVPITLKAQEDFSTFQTGQYKEMGKFDQQLTFQSQDRNAEKLSSYGVAPVLAYTGFGGNFPIARTSRVNGLNKVATALPGNPFQMGGVGSQTIGGTGI